MRVYALRGAISVNENEREEILAATSELLAELVVRNGLKSDDMVSCLLTCTPDLDAEVPAVAARELGMEKVPLLCMQEVDVLGALPRCIRVMIHYYAEEGHRPQHVYLKDAKELRSDLSAAQ